MHRQNVTIKYITSLLVRLAGYLTSFFVILSSFVVVSMGKYRFVRVLGGIGLFFGLYLMKLKHLD